MSVNKIRKFMPATCGIIFAVVVGGALILSMFAPTSQIQRFTQEEEQGLGGVAFTVNGEPIYQAEILEAIRQGEQQSLQHGHIPGPFEALNARVMAVQNGIRRGLLFSLAKAEKIELKEEEIVDALLRQQEEQIKYNMDIIKMDIESRIKTLEVQLETAKNEKGETSDEYLDLRGQIEDLQEKPLEQHFADKFGATPEQLRGMIKQQFEQIELTSLDKLRHLEEVAQIKLYEKEKANVDVSEEAVRKSYQKFTIQTLLVSQANNPDPMAKAADILNRIRAGLKFEEAVAQFSDYKATTPEEKPEEMGIDTQERLTILAEHTLIPILNLKEGEISDVIKLDNGAGIVKILKIEDAVPDNFEEIKQKRADAMRERLGTTRFLRKYVDARENMKIEWKTPALELIYLYDELRSGIKGQKLRGVEKREERLQEWQNLLTKARAQLEIAPDYAAPVVYVCIGQIDADTIEPEQKESVKKQRLELYEQISRFIVAPSFKFEYVTLLLEEKRGNDALRVMKEIVDVSYVFNDDNRQNVEKVESMLVTAANYADEDSPLISEVREKIKKWYEEEKEAKRLEEEQRKRAEEAIKEAEEKRKQEEQKQNQPQGSNQQGD